MEYDEMICPILSIHEITDCMLSKCFWYNTIDKRCSMTVISEELKILRTLKEDQMSKEDLMVNP